MSSMDSFLWASPGSSHFFSWSLPASVPCCDFSFGPYTGMFDSQDVYFSCSAESCVDQMTSYWEHFSQSIFTEVNGMITFIPGTYQDVYGFTDQWGATMTIADPPGPTVITPEGSTLNMFLIFVALVAWFDICFHKFIHRRKNEQVPHLPGSRRPV
jgi:hypothetical protein